jgi:dolichol-phosphate mannosyltransferase
MEKLSASPKTLVFIPTYNEKENVLPLYELLKKQGLAFDVVFLDDNSPDGTGRMLDDLASKNVDVKVIHRTGKQGIGSAHQAGIAYAYDHGYDVLVTMDSDFTHSPSDIPRLLERLKDHDVVVGSRYLKENSLEGWNLFRKFMTLTAHILTTVLLDLKYDATGAFRVFNLRAVPREIFGLVQSKSYSFFFESLHILNFNKFSIAEVPISLPPRTYGHSKMQTSDALKSLQFLFDTFIRTQFQKHTISIERSGSVEKKTQELLCEASE